MISDRFPSVRCTRSNTLLSLLPKCCSLLPNSTKMQKYSGKMGLNVQRGDFVLKLELKARGVCLDFFGLVSSIKKNLTLLDYNN